MSAKIKNVAKVSGSVIEKARVLANEGKTKAQVKGFLLLEGIAESECADILRELGLTRVMGDFRDWLYSELAKGPMSKDVFKSAIKGATENAKKHESHYCGIVELVNRVHAKAAK